MKKQQFMNDLRFAYYSWHYALIALDDKGIKGEAKLNELENKIKEVHGNNILDKFTRWSEKIKNNY